MLGFGKKAKAKKTAKKVKGVLKRQAKFNKKIRG
jgi:hypothetical protein